MNEWIIPARREGELPALVRQYSCQKCSKRFRILNRQEAPHDEETRRMSGGFSMQRHMIA